MVWLPRCLSIELSLVLGTLIANRLPTVQSRPWRKALIPWDEYGGISLIKEKNLKQVPDASWPIETVFFCRHGKKTFGDGELILWELKLLGENADHNFFLEIILPVLEEAASTVNKDWQSPNCLWGHFDIHSIYVARGCNWEPLVNNGRLDLRYHATPLQWSEGLISDSIWLQRYHSLTWVTPFDLADNEKSKDREDSMTEIRPCEIPTMSSVLEALINRLTALIPGKHKAKKDLWDFLGVEEQEIFRDAMDKASKVSIRYKKLEPVSKLQPGRWIGTQQFYTIPKPVIPYLVLASIFHIGKHTHFGCGTFVIS